MALSNGPNTGLLSYGLPGEAHYLDLTKQWRWMDFFLNPNVISSTVTAPPGSPANGDAYIVPTGATGAWSAQVGKIARWTTEIAVPAWEFMTPKAGWAPVFDKSRDTTLRNNGTIWTPESNLMMPFGQCYLYLSGGNLVLSRRNGKYIFINGLFREIPAAGVTLSAAGASVGTAYNIYAYWTGSAIALEYSTTARAADTSWGYQIKNGDPTRTLVGKAYANTGPAWIDTADSNGVISWYNRLVRRLQGVNTVASFTTTAATELLSGNSRCYFLSWGEDAVHARCSMNGNIVPNGPVAFLESRIYWGGGGIVSGSSGYQQAPVSGTWGMVTSEVEGTPIENSGNTLPGNLTYATAFAWFNTAGATYNVASGSILNRLTFYG